MMNAFFVVSFVVLVVAERVHRAAACTNRRKPPPPSYHLTKECAESKMRTVASSNATAFSSCVQLATAKNAFAFAHAANRTEDSSDVPDAICHVYECPESHGFLLQTGAAEKNVSSAYDYYSMYSKPMPTTNYTCAPGIGMFELVTADVLNYSNAMTACEDAGGHLANVFSDSRTSFLASLVSASLINQTAAAYRRAFVGLFYENDDFIAITGEPLSCMPYRAWAPAHPKASGLKHDCVVVTANRYWQTVECSMKLPYICELIPDGPLSPVERYCAPISNTKRRNKCILRNHKQYEQVDQRKQQCIYNINNTVKRIGTTNDDEY